MKATFHEFYSMVFWAKKIYMQRGIRQGDPVSGYLFNIAAEILAKQMTESKKFTGIEINPSTEIRLSKYADDTIIFFLMDQKIRY